MPEISYCPSPELWRGYESLLVDLGQKNRVEAVAELGAGANPMLANVGTWGFVPGRVVFDVSVDELSKSDDNIDKRVADLCQPIPYEHGCYDMVFSKMLCEHLPDPRTFHQNCFDLLRPGGLSVHFFPTLFAMPFIVNRLLPEAVTAPIVRIVQPGRLDNPKKSKFPALYRWCKGPTTRTLERYRSIGFDVVEWRGGFGHHYYGKVPLINVVEGQKSKFLIRHPVAFLTSYAIVVLQKPNDPD